MSKVDLEVKIDKAFKIETLGRDDYKEDEYHHPYEPTPYSVLERLVESEYIIDENVIKYIDYDLDLRVFPDGGFRILDRNEYNYHKKIMKYSDELDSIIKSELSHLIDIKRSESGPFAAGVVDKYYDVYEKIKKS